jgi:hypothetical protein
VLQIAYGAVVPELCAVPVSGDQRSNYSGACNQCGSEKTRTASDYLNFKRVLHRGEDVPIISFAVDEFR